MAIEFLGCFEELHDSGYELCDERGVFICCYEIRLQRGKDGRVSVHFQHTLKRTYVLLHFIEGIKSGVKTDDPRSYASICPIDELIPYYLIDPAKSLGEGALAIGHDASIFLEDVE